MNKSKPEFTFIFLICLLAIQICKAQTANPRFQYDYDASGNRIKRIYHPQRLEDTTVFKDNVSGHEIKVYPNPTSGALVINIADFKDISQSKLEIYDMTGRLVFKKEALNEFTNVNLRNERSGNYFLKIFLDDKMKQWKVVKTE